MNILALSYTNIGPFANQSKTVTFLPGSTLVSAPIGTGKSFLFFDGPLFALYKYSSRPMLSRTCKQGSISCIFYYEQQRYYIQRQLKPTKSGNDSVQSRLRTLSQDPTPFFEGNEMVQDEEILFSTIASFAEEIQFSSGRELDDSMKQLLPPRELVQSVYLLMQESDHVFELPPAQRINVFKHLFGLIGIDEAKEKLTERRKELMTTTKILEDDTQSHEKFDRMIQILRTVLQEAKRYPIPSPLHEPLTNIIESPTFVDIVLLDTEISLQGFTLEADLLQQCVQAIQILQDYQKYGYDLKSQIRALTTTLQELKTSKDGQHKQLELLDAQTQKATLLYKQLDEEIVQKKQKQQLYIESVRTESQISFSLQGIAGVDEESTVQDIVGVIQDAIQQGKDLVHHMSMLTQQQTNEDQKIESLRTDIAALDTQLQAVSQKYDQQMKFECDKIKGPCPYVDVIKGAAVRSLQEQQTILAQQKEKKSQQLQGLQTSQERAERLQKHSQLEKKKSELGSVLGALHWKQTLEQRERYQSIKQQYDTITASLQQLTTQRESIQLPDPAVLQERKNLILQQIAEYTSSGEEKKSQLQTMQHQYDGGAYEAVDPRLTAIQRIEKAGEQILELIDTYREKHQKIQAYKDELKRNKELTAIFSKELMIVALQDFLPSLETVINTFLDEVVDYQIKFLTPESIDDSLELDIEIHDGHGIRQVKSLSGGQRATLKIAWILAVSSLFNGQFLFLDETITSLDAEAVGRIGRLLESYMKKRNTTLLLVTHASQIQDMEMWERVVRI